MFIQIQSSMKARKLRSNESKAITHKIHAHLEARILGREGILQKLTFGKPNKEDSPAKRGK